MTVTVGTNDVADKTGDLIVTFVDVTGVQGVTTDGTRTALPGAPWGCYIVAPSISAVAGCVVTLTPPATDARWESCSLIWQPPPHSAVLWTTGGAFNAAGGVSANPKWPPTSALASGETDATASVSARAQTRLAIAGSINPAAGLSGRAQIRAAVQATHNGSGGISGLLLGPGATIWPMAGRVDTTASAGGRARMLARLSGEADAVATLAGDLQVPHQTYFLSGATNAAASSTSSIAIGHQYLVTGSANAAAGVIPFGGNAPQRVTNWVRNPRPEGAVVGAVDGGSNSGPTDWWLLYANPDSNLAVAVVGTGTESEIPFVDIRWNNATAPGGWMSIQTDSGIAATPGLIWSYGVFVRLVAGSLANVTSIAPQLLSDATAGVGTYTGASFTPTSAALSTQWITFNNVLINDAGTADIAAGLVINTGAGAVDLTLRLGGPRAEKATAAHGPQFLVVPAVGRVPAFGGSTTYVY